MKISVIQMNSQDDKAKNIADAEALIRKAVAEDKSDLVVLPETFTYMGGTVESRRAHAETFPDGEAPVVGGDGLAEFPGGNHQHPSGGCRARRSGGARIESRG